MRRRKTLQLIMVAALAFTLSTATHAAEWKFPVEVAPYIRPGGNTPPGLRVTKKLDPGCDLDEGDLITSVSGSPITRANVESQIRKLSALEGPQEIKVKVISAGDVNEMLRQEFFSGARRRGGVVRAETVSIALVTEAELKERTVAHDARLRAEGAAYQQQRRQWVSEKKYSDDTVVFVFNGRCPLHGDKGKTGYAQEGREPDDCKCGETLKGNRCEFLLQWKSTGDKRFLRTWPDGSKTLYIVRADGRVDGYEIDD